jgi:hypothetical protein
MHLDVIISTAQGGSGAMIELAARMLALNCGLIFLSDKIPGLDHRRQTKILRVGMAPTLLYLGENNQPKLLTEKEEKDLDGVPSAAASAVDGFSPLIN